MDLARDEDGHLANAEGWSEAVANAFAREAGVELGEEHWQVIGVVRRFYAETGVSPSMRPLVKLLRERGCRQLASSIALLRLFPGSAATLAAKIAGLPRPDKCL